jgi:hypothetical protein
MKTSKHKTRSITELKQLFVHIMSHLAYAGA